MVTRYGHGVPRARIEIVEAAHPVPDAAGQAAAARILELAHSAGPDDLVLCLISGGALVPADATGRWLDAGGQAGGQPGVARQWCGYRAYEQGPPPSLRPKSCTYSTFADSYTTADIIPLRITTSVEYTGYRRDHKDTGDIRA